MHQRDTPDMARDYVSNSLILNKQRQLEVFSCQTADLGGEIEEEEEEVEEKEEEGEACSVETG